MYTLSSSVPRLTDISLPEARHPASRDGIEGNRLTLRTTCSHQMGVWTPGKDLHRGKVLPAELPRFPGNSRQIKSRDGTDPNIGLGLAKNASKNLLLLSTDAVFGRGIELKQIRLSTNDSITRFRLNLETESLTTKNIRKEILTTETTHESRWEERRKKTKQSHVIRKDLFTQGKELRC